MDFLTNKIKKYSDKIIANPDTKKKDIYNEKLMHYYNFLRGGFNRYQIRLINNNSNLFDKYYRYNNITSLRLNNNNNKTYICTLSSDFTNENNYFICGLNGNALNSQFLFNSINNVSVSKFSNLIINYIKENKKSINDDVDKNIDNFVNKKGLNFSMLIGESIINNSINYKYNFPYQTNLNLLLSKIKSNKDLKVNHVTNPDVNFLIKKKNPFGFDAVGFSGGGARGFIYVGTLFALITSGLIYYLKTYVGTSAGAINALIVSCITCNKNINDKLSNCDNLKQILEENPEIINKYWTAVIYIMQELYQQSFLDFFNINDPMNIINLPNGSLLNPNKKFIPWLSKVCKNVCKIMENDLYHLIADDYDENINDNFFTFNQYYNITGKKLIFVTSDGNKYTSIFITNDDNGKKIYGDNNVLNSVKSSMAIPLIFPSGEITNNKEKILCYDGGIFDNIPCDTLDIYNNDNDLLYYYRNILTFVLDSGPVRPYETLRNLNEINVNLKQMLATLEAKNIGYTKSKKTLELINDGLYIINSIESLLNINNFNKYLIDNFDIFTNEFNKLNNYNKKNINNNVIKLLQDCNDKIDALKIYLINNTNVNINDHSSINYEIIINNFIKITNDLNEISNLFDKICKIKNEISINKLDSIEQSDNHVIFENKFKNLIDDLIDNNIKTNALFLHYWHTVEYTEELNNLKYKNLDILLEKIINIGELYIKFTDNYNDYDASYFGLFKNNVIKYGSEIGIGLIIGLVFGFRTEIVGLLSSPTLKKFESLLGTYYLMINDKTQDKYNKLRLVNLNTFNSSFLNFNIDNDLKNRLLYEGYQKTIKHLAKTLFIQEASETYLCDLDPYLN